MTASPPQGQAPFPTPSHPSSRSALNLKQALAYTGAPLQAGDAAILNDLSFFVTAWNEGAERLTGWAAKEVVGRAFPEALKLEFLGVDRNQAAFEIIQGDRFEGDVLLLHKSGSPRFVRMVSYTLKSGGGDIQGHLFVLRDQTRRSATDPRIHNFLRATERIHGGRTVEQVLDAALHDALRMIPSECGCRGLRTPQGLTCKGYLRKGQWFPLAFTWASGRGYPGWVLANAQPALTNQPARDPRREGDWNPGFKVRSSLCVPVMDSRQSVVGFLRLDNKQGRRGYTEMDGRDLTTLACVAGTAIQMRTSEGVNGAVRERDERFLAAVLSAQEEERSRIARELHDDVGQLLTAMLIGLKTLTGAATWKERHRHVRRMRGITLEAIAGIKRLALGLRPHALDDLGLPAALGRHLAEFTKGFRIRSVLRVKGMKGERLAAPVETALYRIVQEALTNVAKHARARAVRVSLERSAKAVRVRIRDDGRGFHPGGGDGEEKGEHLGLRGMRERVALLGGTLTVRSHPRSGTEIAAEIPLTPVPRA